MKVIVSGGTGFIGEALVGALLGNGHDVVLLTRNRSLVATQSSTGPRYVHWDGIPAGEWVSVVDGADGVINLSGETISKRWTEARKKRILDSRIGPTHALIEAMRSARKRPRVMVNMSAVGYYGHVPTGEVVEDHPSGEGFLADMCRQWEAEARKVEELGVRLVLLRTGVVLGPGGGALIPIKRQFMLYAGGPVGSGKQWFPWVHRDDVAGAMVFALRHDALAGPVNVVAPEYATNNVFSAALGAALHRPSWAPVPGFVLRLMFGEMADVLLTGQKVVPQVLVRSGYKFTFPRLDLALPNIVG